jgi:hypothetical protein
VKAAEGLSAKGGLSAGLSGGQEAGAEGSGASGHVISFWGRNKKARRVGGLFGLYFYFRRLGEIVRQEKQGAER